MTPNKLGVLHTLMLIKSNIASAIPLRSSALSSFKQTSSKDFAKAIFSDVHEGTDASLHHTPQDNQCISVSVCARDVRQDEMSVLC